MAIGTSLGAYFDDEFHHQAGINTDPSQDRIDVDPEVDSQSTKPKPELDILPIGKKNQMPDKNQMPFPDNHNPDSDFASRFGNLPPSGILNDMKKPDPDRPLLRRISDTQNGQDRLYVSPSKPDPEPAPDYDMEGWKAANPDARMSPGQHYPDTFKLPNHITFSNESKYSTDDTPGGQWAKQDDGSWSFTPSAFNLKQHSAEELQSYFDKYEKGNKLNLPSPEVDPNTPETFVNPLAKKTLDVVGSVLHGIAEIPKRAIGAATEYTNEGTYNVGPILDAASLGIGVSPVGKLAGEVKALGQAKHADDLTPEAREAFRQFDEATGYHEGPSPFEQVASAARRARPEDETDRALRAIHETLGLDHGDTLRAERSLAEDSQGRAPLPRESFDELMARLDREDLEANNSAFDRARGTDAFKDYGKAQVAYRGFGNFLFKVGDSKVMPLNVSEREGGKTLYVNYIGGQLGKDENIFGKNNTVMKSMFKMLADKYPNAEEIAGFRVGGARTGRAAVVRMRIPGRGKSNPPRKSIEDLSHEWENPEAEARADAMFRQEGSLD